MPMSPYWSAHCGFNSSTYRTYYSALWTSEHAKKENILQVIRGKFWKFISLHNQHRVKSIDSILSSRLNEMGQPHWKHFYVNWKVRAHLIHKAFSFKIFHWRRRPHQKYTLSVTIPTTAHLNCASENFLHAKYETYFFL